jgi:hypothetical protein
MLSWGRSAQNALAFIDTSPIMVYLQRIHGCAFQVEEQLIWEHCQEQSIPCKTFTLKNILRRNLPLTQTDMVVGTVDAVTGALKQFKKTIPFANTYPNSLSGFYGRSMEKSTLSDIRSRMVLGMCSATFIKPADNHKTFTGFVARSDVDLYRIASLSGRTPIWAVEPVQFLSEYRYYVNKGCIVHSAHYDGNPDIQPDADVVQNIIDTLSGAYDHTPTAYAVDIGVLTTNNTVVVEVNEGYSLGAYHNPPAALYFDLLQTRWLQLMR